MRVEPVTPCCAPHTCTAYTPWGNPLRFMEYSDEPVARVSRSITAPATEYIVMSTGLVTADWKDSLSVLLPRLKFKAVG